MGKSMRITLPKIEDRHILVIVGFLAFLFIMALIGNYQVGHQRTIENICEEHNATYLSSDYLSISCVQVSNETVRFITVYTTVK